MKKGYNLLVLKALSFFAENPYEEIHLREFSRRLKISANSSQRFLNFFLNEGLVKEEKKANLRYFKADLDSIVFRNIKITFSLKKLENSGLLDDLKETASHVVLFGSMAKGLDDFKSDIDLVCIGASGKEIKEIIAKKQEKLDREITPHVFSWLEWKKQPRTNKAFYQEVISTGINLIGEMPLVD
ncbi:nucleotidyltransferase domain-containing protein [Candidatus Pacearchaeota archaeon]|nr:nucleotidyltransferase domain-containing protein [Candidatus Pacearchaeota archaeon]